MDWNDLKQHIGVKNNDNDKYIKKCFAEAVVLIADATAKPFRVIPQEVIDRLVLEVGYTLYSRKSAPGNGQFQQYDGDVTPVRVPRDPLFEVKHILNRYVVPFV